MIGLTEDGRAEIVGGAVRVLAEVVIEKMGKAVRAEGETAAAADFDDAFGEQEQAGAGFEGLEGGLVGEEGEEAEGHAGVGKDAGAVAVAEDGGLAAGVDVGEDAEVEVVTAEEGGGEADSGAGGGEGLVDVVGEDGDGVGEVGAGSAEELGSAVAKGVLRGGCDGVGAVAFTGDVGQEKDDVRAEDEGVEKVTGGAGGVVMTAEVQAFERRKGGGSGRTGRQRAGGLV